MAAEGYEAATLARIVEESSIPISSVYHYFGSKDGVLLAVMERGAERFFARVPDATERRGDARDHLEWVLEQICNALEQESDFLRLVVVMAVQPPADALDQTAEVVGRVRGTALARIRSALALAFGLKASSRLVQDLARMTLAAFDGAFVAHQADPSVQLRRVLRLLPAALCAVAAEEELKL